MKDNPATRINPRYQVFDMTLAAGEAVSMAWAGEFIHCLEASAAFQIGFNDGPQSRFEAGLKYRAPTAFESVQLVNSSGSANTLRLAVGRGDMEDARLVLTGTVSTRGEVPDTLTTKAPVSALDAANTQLAPANALRRELILVNQGAATIYINGKVAVLAGEGIPLEPGQSLILEQRGAVYARNDTGATVPVAVTENGWSA